MRNTIRKIKNISLRIRAMKQYMEGLNHHVSYEEALVELEKFSPNPHTSCYCLGSDIKWGKYDLTVIIPSYNNEKFLPTCLDSIADQSTDYKVQVIVINDSCVRARLSTITCILLVSSLVLMWRMSDW